MKIKKINALIMLVVFLASIVPATFAQESSATSTSNVAPELTPAVSEAKVMDFVSKEVRKDTTLDKCIARVQENFPNVAKERAEVFCRKVLAKPAVISTLRARAVQLKSVAARKINTLNKEQFRNEKQVLLRKALIKCEETEDQETCKANIEKRIEGIQRLAESTIQRLQNFEERKFDKIANFKADMKDEDFKKYAIFKTFKARAIAKEKIVEAKKNYADAKKAYIKSRQLHNETKEKFYKAKQRAKECAEDESEECQEVREEVKENAKKHLLRILDVVLKHLDQLKNRVEANEHITDEEAADLLERINNAVAEAEELKTKVESAETKEEIIEAAKEIRKKWVNMLKHFGIIKGKVVNSQIGGIIVKSRQLEVKLERIMERMTEAGLDTSAVEPLVDDFSESIDLARENYKTAMEKLREAREMEEPDKTLIEEAHQLMREAHDALKDAQSTLRQIVQEIKKVGGEEHLEEEEAEEAAALVDEELVEQEGTEEVSA